MNRGWFSSATVASPPPSLSVVNDKEGRLQTEHTHHNYYIHLTLNLQWGVGCGGSAPSPQVGRKVAV